MELKLLLVFQKISYVAMLTNGQKIFTFTSPWVTQFKNL